MRNFTRIFLLSATLLFSVSFVFSQGKSENRRNFCQDNNWSWNGRESFHELREMSVAATNLLTVDGKINGGISIKGENRSDILVRACVSAWEQTEDAAKKLAKSISVEQGSNIFAKTSAESRSWAVSYEILVPNQTNLNLKAHNGGISINSVDGAIEFYTLNGGVNLSDLAGEVKGATRNGGVSVELSGNSWKGTGLDVETRNGGVNISMSENYAANVETGTVNGGIRSEIADLQPTKRTNNGSGWTRQDNRINTSINGGGAKIRVVTTNGGIQINKN